MIRLVDEATQEELDATFGPEPAERRWYDAPFYPGELAELRRAAALSVLEPPEELVEEVEK